MQRTVAQERSLTMGMPRFVGAVRVVPAPRVDAALQSDPDIEQVGMTVTMEAGPHPSRAPCLIARLLARFSDLATGWN